MFSDHRKSGERLLDVKKGFKKAVKLAAIPDLRFHDLRHTFATRLVQAGVHLVTIQHLLGHARITMTGRYAHAPDAARIAAVARLDSISTSQSVPNRSPGPGSLRAESDLKPMPSKCDRPVAQLAETATLTQWRSAVRARTGLPFISITCG